MPVMKDIVAQHMKQPRGDPFIAVRRQSTSFGSRIGQLKRNADLLDTERIGIFRHDFLCRSPIFFPCFDSIRRGNPQFFKIQHYRSDSKKLLILIGNLFRFFGRNSLYLSELCRILFHHCERVIAKGTDQSACDGRPNALNSARRQVACNRGGRCRHQAFIRFRAQLHTIFGMRSVGPGYNQCLANRNIRKFAHHC